MHAAGLQSLTQRVPLPSGVFDSAALAGMVSRSKPAFPPLVRPARSQPSHPGLPRHRMPKRHSNDDSMTGRGELFAAARSRHGIDVGHEPPLNSSGADAPEVDRREVSLRWLGASVLTGLTGGALIGASIYIALQGAVTVAEPPERADALAPRAPVAATRGTTIRKGDKLVRQEMVASAKQGFKATVAIRAGEREVIRVRQFVRLATNL